MSCISEPINISLVVLNNEEPVFKEYNFLACPIFLFRAEDKITVIEKWFIEREKKIIKNEIMIVS